MRGLLSSAAVAGQNEKRRRGNKRCGFLSPAASAGQKRKRRKIQDPITTYVNESIEESSSSYGEK